MDKATCRICLEENEPFISPCKCNGTIKYVHEECLDTWRYNNKHKKAFLQCEQCLYTYQFQHMNMIPLHISCTLFLYLSACFFIGLFINKVFNTNGMHIINGVICIGSFFCLSHPFLTGLLIQAMFKNSDIELFYIRTIGTFFALSIFYDLNCRITSFFIPRHIRYETYS
jgi:E3 ubiquitin-protein ligase DOA10